jgi:uncharacterized SAM-binding protein YcdF (DUF218 family)
MRRLSKRVRLSVAVIAGLGILSSAPLILGAERVGPLLVTPLEARVARAALTSDDRIAGIIVLGGGAERFVEAVKLAERYPLAKLVITGKGEEAAHDYVRARGVDEARLVLETDARTTYENALFTKQKLAPQAGSRWLLVTSAAHMPRALGSFRKAGFTVLPWPAYQPVLRHFKSQIARHEWLGLLAYRLLGRTDAIFPGPLA